MSTPPKEAQEKDNMSPAQQVLEQVKIIFSLLLQQNNIQAYQNLASLWVPNQEDFERVCTQGAQEAYQRYLQSFPTVPVPLPKQGQVHAIIEAAAPADFHKTTIFPNGLQGIKEQIHPDTIWVCWKFVRPNEHMGMAYNGLVSFDGTLKFFPKAWRYW